MAFPFRPFAEVFGLANWAGHTDGPGLWLFLPHLPGKSVLGEARIKHVILCGSGVAEGGELG